MADQRQRICLVTGGGRGIGAATALLAARSGYRVCVNYVADAGAAASVVAAITQDGGHAIAVGADVSRADEVEALFAGIDDQLGPVAALVNNAGISGERRTLAESDPADLARVIEVNLVGTLLCARAAARRMARSRGGSGGAIVNLSSIAARTGGDRLAAYVAAKAGVEGLTRALAPELAAEGIRINAVCPGVIATDQNAGAADRRATIPLGRTGAPEEVANAILWLLSDAASYVTGATLSVSGGK